MPFQSKFRHVFGEEPKSDGQYMDVKNPYTSGEGSYAAANGKYWAVSKAGGGGPVYVHPHSKPGRQTYKTVNVHKGKALDFQFHPFVENILGVASEDCSLSITQFKDDMPEDVTEATVIMKGHLKKCQLMRFAPSANNILCSASWDKTLKLWDVTSGECVQTYERCEKAAFSLSWKQDSSLLAMTAKDKSLRVLDPRDVTKEAMFIEEAMEGSKSSKCVWFDKFGWILSTGFNKSAKRMVKVWDVKNLDKPLYSQVIDQQSSVLMPYVDHDVNMIYLFGKGDGSVNYYEFVNDKRVLYALGSFRNPDPQKGGAFVPKRALDTQKCEVARFMRLTKNAVSPVSFIVPRKSGRDIFQSDIYPDTDAGVPAMSAEEYLAGKVGPNPTMSMDPANSGSKPGTGSVAFEAKKPYGELVKENEDLKKRIAELESELEKHYPESKLLKKNEDEAKKD